MQNQCCKKDPCCPPTKCCEPKICCEVSTKDNKDCWKTKKSCCEPNNCCEEKNETNNNEIKINISCMNGENFSASNNYNPTNNDFEKNAIKICTADTKENCNTWNLENNSSSSSSCSSCSCCSSNSESDCCSEEENINKTNISVDGYQIDLGINGDNDNYQKTVKTNQYLSGYGNYPININYDNNNWNISVPNSVTNFDCKHYDSRNMHDDSDNDNDNDNDNVDEYSVNMHLSESDSEEVMDRYPIINSDNDPAIIESFGSNNNDNTNLYSEKTTEEYYDYINEKRVDTSEGYYESTNRKFESSDIFESEDRSFVSDDEPFESDDNLQFDSEIKQQCITHVGPITEIIGCVQANIVPETNKTIINQPCNSINNQATLSWATRIGGINLEEGVDIVTDGCDNVITIGFFEVAIPSLDSPIPIEPTTIIYNSNGTIGGILTNTLTKNVFIVKHDYAGIFLWAAKITHVGATASVAVDGHNNIIVTGSYDLGSTTFFDSKGNNIASVVGTLNDTNSYIVKYDPDGNILSVNNITVQPNLTQSNLIISTGVATDIEGNVYVTGYYKSLGPVLFLDSTNVSTSTANINVPLTNLTSLANITPANTGLANLTPSNTLANLIPTNKNTSVLLRLNNPISIVTLPPSSNSIDDNNNAFIAKYDKNGRALWATRLVNPNAQLGNIRSFGIAINSKSEVIVTGIYNPIPIALYNAPNGSIDSGLFLDSDPNVINNTFLVKYSTDGQAIWATRASGVGNGAYNFGEDVAVDSCDNIIVIGNYLFQSVIFYNTPNGTVNSGIQLPNSSFVDIYIAKYNTDGVALWATRIAGSEFQTAEIGAETTKPLAIDHCNNIIVSGIYLLELNPVIFYNVGGSIGSSLQGTGSANGFIVKYNSNGQVIWVTKQVSADEALTEAVAVDKQNNVVATGTYRTNPNIPPILLQNQTTPLEIYNSKGELEFTLLNDGDFDAFIVKYINYGQEIILEPPQNPCPCDEFQKTISLNNFVCINTLVKALSGSLVSGNAWDQSSQHNLPLCGQSNGRQLRGFLLGDPGALVNLCWKNNIWTITYSQGAEYLYA